MRLWALLDEIPYEGYRLAGVYDTLRQAAWVADQFEPLGLWVIEEIVLNQNTDYTLDLNERNTL